MLHWLDRPIPSDARLGGKAAPLAALAGEGLPVPPGFVLDASAYEAAVASHPAVARAVVQQAAYPPDAVAAALAPAVAGLPLPDALEAAIRDAYGALASRLGTDAPAVAVRSSALGEDGEVASFAGQQATYLNVVGPEAVVAAVKACWAGLWSERSVAYRRRVAGAEAPAMAVLVQALVAPEVAGVAFSAHPVTGARDVVIVDASWGLGEAVVSGRVTPDHVILEKATGRVTAYLAGDKAVEVVPEGAGVGLRDVPSDRRAARALDDAALARLAELARRVEALRGAPQDLEWALEGGRLWLLQSRPITGLPPAPPPGGWTSPIAGATYERRNFAEHFGAPVSPLARTLLLPAVAEAVSALAAEVGWKLGAPAVTTLHGWAYARADMTRRWDWPWRAARQFLDAWRRSPKAWQRAPGGSHEARVAVLLAHPPAPDDAAGLVAWVEAFVEQFAVTWRDVHRLSGGWRWTELWLGQALGDRAGDAGVLLQGFDSPALALERQLHELAQAADAEVLAALGAERPLAALEALGPAARRFLDGLAAVMAAGRALPASLDPATSLPFESPDDVCRLVLARRHAGGASPAERLAGLARAREAASMRLLAEVEPWRRALLKQVLPRAQAYAAEREPALAMLGHGWAAFRERLLALGAIFARDGRLSAPGDVFTLSWEEAKAMAAGAPGPGTAVLAARQEEWEAQARSTPPAAVGGAPERTLGRAISGVGASPGRVTGVARVIRGPEDFATFAAGEVLVATATTPAWTPLFHLAAAIVTDVGGPLSHGSIVAREFRIPAVLGTTSATRRLRTGDVVTVDGDYGLVWRGDG